MDGLFNPKNDVNSTKNEPWTWHTSDRSTDYINANEGICPRLTDINALATQSPEFTAYMKSEFVKKVKDELAVVVGRVSWDSILECCMIARYGNLEKELRILN